MRRALVISLFFHVAVSTIAYFGVPYLDPEPLITENPIFVDVVNAADESNPPPQQLAPEPKVQKAKELSTITPEPIVEPEPQLIPETQVEVADLPPKPEHASEPEPKIEKKIIPKPKIKAKLKNIRPPKKPKPPDAFTSVLKTLEAMAKTRPDKKPKPKDLKDEMATFEEAIAVALNSNPKQNYDPHLPVSMSETDAIRKHFQSCWNVPAGAKGAEDMVVELEIRFLQDGSVRSVQVLNSARMRMDSFFKITAEAAQRAVLHPRCNKLSMPPDKFPNWQSKYQRWQKMTLVFDPKDMF